MNESLSLHIILLKSNRLSPVYGVSRNVPDADQRQPGLTPTPGNVTLSGPFATCYAFHLQTILYSFQEKRKDKERKKERRRCQNESRRMEDRIACIFRTQLTIHCLKDVTMKMRRAHLLQ